MRTFERNLITEWRRLGVPSAGVPVVVALSGGADSLALAAAVAALRDEGKLEIRVVLAHFNHNLRGAESEADERFVRGFAESRGLELAVGRGARFDAGNLEQAAREARYAFLEEVAENLHSRIVLTAHTVDDQAETFLMNLIRGAGPKGLSGMPSIREIGRSGEFDVFPTDDSSGRDGRVHLVRPLLTWARRAETENYCREAGLEPRYDSMNEDVAFTRVRIRKQLLPVLRGFNPKITEALSRTAELLRLELTEHEAGIDEVLWESETLSVAELKPLPRGVLTRGLRAWLGSRRGGLRGIEQTHVTALAELILSTKSGRTVEIPGGGRVVKSKGLVTFRK